MQPTVGMDLCTFLNNKICKSLGACCIFWKMLDSNKILQKEVDWGEFAFMYIKFLKLLCSLLYSNFSPTNMGLAFQVIIIP